MVRHNQGRLILLLILSVFALASCKSASKAAFLPRQITEEVRSATAPEVSFASDLKRPHANDVVSNLTRGGAVPVPTVSELKGATVFLVLDHLFRKAFKAQGIAFPSQLGGCCILLTLMVLLELIIPGVGDGIFAWLSPGAGILARWLPVFFVPGLALFPLAPSMGSPVEVCI